jgi:hypothetical protein
MRSPALEQGAVRGVADRVSRRVGTHHQVECDDGRQPACLQDR